MTTNVESTTLESTLPIKDEDPPNDSSTTFSTNTVEESTIATVEELSSVDDATTESTTLLSEMTGNDAVTGEKIQINATLRNKGTVPSNLTNAAFKEDLEHVNSTVSL